MPPHSGLERSDFVLWPKAAVEVCLLFPPLLEGKQTLGELPENDAHDPYPTSAMNAVILEPSILPRSPEFGAKRCFPWP